MQFLPKTEAEIEEERQKRFGLLPEGEYEFKIVDAVDGVSKASSNQMITLTLQILQLDENDQVRSCLIKDYLVESAVDKIYNVCKAVGLEEKYNTGSVNADDFKDKAGVAKITIKKDKSGRWPDSNSVKYYVTPKLAFSARPPQPPVAAPLDDDIPF